MYKEIDEHLLEYVADYRINLMTPEKMTDEELAKFHTELRQIMTYIKYSEDKEALKQVIDSDETFSHLDKDAADVLNVVTGSKLKYDDDEEEVDMCKAIKDMMADSMAEGREEGAAETIILDGFEDKKSKEEIIAKLMRRLHLTEAKSKEYFEKYATTYC